MNMRFENNIFYCEVQENLTAINIKTMMDKVKAVIEASADDFETMKIDLSKAQSIDSLGITFLISTYKSLVTKNRKMILYKVPDSIRQLFKIMKLDEAFQIED